LKTCCDQLIATIIGCCELVLLFFPFGGKERIITLVLWEFYSAFAKSLTGIFS